MLGLIFPQSLCHGVVGGGVQVSLSLDQDTHACVAGASQSFGQLVQVPLDLAHPNSFVTSCPRTACMPRAKTRQSRRLAASARVPAGVIR
jgi:hypothetical protein